MQLTIREHFLELRNRVIFSLISFVIIFALCYFFSEKIYEFLLQPFAEISENSKNRRLIYTSLSEAFVTYLRLSFTSALFFSFPIFAVQIYLFLSPALYKKEKKNILKIFLFAVFLFLLGAAFAYFFILPVALKFFAAFETQGFAALQARFNARDAIKGLEVASSDGHQGKCMGVDAQGVLQIQTQQGLIKINSAEVSVRPL